MMWGSGSVALIWRPHFVSLAGSVHLALLSVIRLRIIRFWLMLPRGCDKLWWDCLQDSSAMQRPSGGCADPISGLRQPLSEATYSP